MRTEVTESEVRDHEARVESGMRIVIVFVAIGYLAPLAIALWRWALG